MQVQSLLGVPIIMNHSRAYKQFKKRFGQANHFLITTIIALHDLDNSERIQAPEELRTTWNPMDKHASVVRSRSFVLHSFLNQALDSIDFYLSSLRKKPFLMQDVQQRQDFDGKQFVSAKIEFANTLFDISEIDKALVDILLQWRNNTIHSAAGNEVSVCTKKTIASKASDIEAKYCGLNALSLPDKARSGACLTFKETAALIHAAHEYVRQIDSSVMTALDMGAFCRDALVDAVRRSDSLRTKYYGFSTGDKKKLVKEWIQNELGFSVVENEVIESCLRIPKT